MAKGCDYAWGRPNLSALRQQGITFACRYLSYDRTGKNLSRDEANRLLGSGINVVSNWEWGEKDAAAGFARGAQHAHDANFQHFACGGPGNAPIYFSVDYDAQPIDYHGIAGYFDGVASVIGVARTGVYAGFPVASMLWSSSRVRWIWQTTAWSRGQRHPQTSIYQHQYNLWIGGGQVDIDESYGANYGQWGAPAPGAPEIEPNRGSTDLATPFRLLGEYSATIGDGLQGLAHRAIDLIR